LLQVCGKCSHVHVDFLPLLGLTPLVLSVPWYPR
jgi:hypothetical protein